jgi:hypothetical protein
VCRDAPDQAVFSERERLLLRMCDALHARARIDDELWAALAAEWRPDQRIELVVLAGFYHTISFAANALALPPEAFAARFPEG